MSGDPALSGNTAATLGTGVTSDTVATPDAAIRLAPSASPSRGGAARRWTATALLASAIVAWAALPLTGGAAGTRPALVGAAACGALSLLQLAIGPPRFTESVFTPLLLRAADQTRKIVSAVPWPGVMIIAVLALEALHPSRPWHTAVLGAAIVAFLLALHLAETGPPPRVLRPQLPLLAAGAGLLAISVGAAALPSAGGGLAATALLALAAGAAVIVGALALPL
ncbi:MAG: hypothetical protein ACLPUO_06115 [Streptosporangiaceae bacterium]|jgi:hypothetical protein